MFLGRAIFEENFDCETGRSIGSIYLDSQKFIDGLSCL